MSLNIENGKALQALTALSEGDYQAFLYDCDGTLADNMGAHKLTYVAVAERQGVTIDPAIIDEFAGLPIPAVVKEINKRYSSRFDPLIFEAQKAEIFYSEYIEKTQPIKYVVDHLLASAGKLRIGVVSGGARKSVQRTLEVLGIADLVEVLVCAGDTAKGKPYPDPFLKAAALLGVAPDKCLVFEDGEPGVQAAEAAGMRWIRIDQV
ncbi:HAD family hydrolase [Pontibacter ramchanderi]|uniref:HAD superfamily hydrolase (TIGR01509 family)/HAD superfamily hydrolase (TIGR01549 family) n=1 Tax=Pontibacter ramchanderi TaxID=1179743 RepID=A0A2N3V2V2_9BACT|nr:HAD family phosphatase [Pontibacter ramchanderi]PKV75965.1 HAD superfamily hydrolase (TIGR01509 family)/HAD superfamily hydrolase (TIGR01549 family) [Pontibacter ramchanderi]